jgi:hypothetical protein
MKAVVSENTKKLSTYLYEIVWKMYQYIASWFEWSKNKLITKKENFTELDSFTKKEFVKYLQTTKFKPYNITQETVTQMENVKLTTNDIYSNMVEMAKTLGENQIEEQSTISTKNSFYRRYMFPASFDLVKDYDGGEFAKKTDVELVRRYDIKKPKHKLNACDIDVDEFINSFGDAKSSRDMMGVSKKLLQTLPQYYHKKIVAMYNKSLHGDVNEKYCFGKASFVWKGKGEKQVLKSYRKITAVPNTLNHLHRILNLRLSQYFEKNEYFDKTIQKAGLSGSSYGIFEQVYKLRSIIKDANMNKKPAAVLYLDMSSAFDTLDRDALFKILKDYYVSDNFVSYLKNFYDNLEYYISSRNKHTELKKWKSGILQGCSLSPLLFTVCMNYVLTYLHKTSLNSDAYQFHETEDKILFLAFMDDVCITCNSMESLGEIYTELLTRFESMGLRINMKKSAVMTINTEMPENSSLKDIPVVTEQTYLGNTITSDGNYEKNYKSVKNRIYSQLMSIKSRKDDDKESIFKKLYPVIKRQMLKLYDVEDAELEKLKWMINMSLKDMNIDHTQFNFDISNTREYVVSISHDKVIKKIPEKINKVKRTKKFTKPSKLDLEELREAYENNKVERKNKALAEELNQPLNKASDSHTNSEKEEQQPLGSKLKYELADLDLVSDSDDDLAVEDIKDVPAQMQQVQVQPAQVKQVQVQPAQMQQVQEQ